MRLGALRNVLLVQGIEETDRTGEVIPLADRTDATRSAAREVPHATAETGAPLSRQTQMFLQRRADLLLEKLRLRAPAIAHVFALAAGPVWAGRALHIIAFLVGMSLASLDGSRRINILAFPLIGLIAWNLLVYVLLVIAWFRGRVRGPHPREWASHAYERWIARRIESLLRHATRFNVPLSAGLRRFVRDWSALARPLWVLQVKRVMHFAAMWVALGLVAGLYLRGLVLRYEAGWESTFLGPSSAHALLELLYGPAAAISGIALGTPDELRALRWTAAGGGGDAAPWIHLIALTATLYIVLPRFVAGAAAAVGVWRFSRRAPLPSTLMGYARALVISAGGGTVTETATVIPYAYEPSPQTLAGLELLLGAAFGANVRMSVREPVKYGDEEALAGAPPSKGSWTVILMTLASTPEAENHGRVIATVRDSLAGHVGTALLVAVDAGPFVSRMRGETVFDQRVQERRKLWSGFIAGYGLSACFANLAELQPGNVAELEARDAARAAVWSAGGK